MENIKLYIKNGIENYNPIWGSLYQSAYIEVVRQTLDAPDIDLFMKEFWKVLWEYFKVGAIDFDLEKETVKFNNSNQKIIEVKLFPDFDKLECALNKLD